MTTLSVRTLNKIARDNGYDSVQDYKNDQKLTELLGRLLYKCTFIKGSKGKGKSLSDTAIAYEIKERYGKVVTCVGTSLGLDKDEFGKFNYLTVEKFIKTLELFNDLAKGEEVDVENTTVKHILEDLGLLNGILILDEAYKLLESRTPGKKPVLAFGHFMSASRHYKCTTLMSAPSETMIDKRVRLQFDYIGRATSTCRTVMNNKGEPICIRMGCPHTVTTRFMDGHDYPWKLKWYGPTYFPKYNSFNTVGFNKSTLDIKPEQF